MPKLFSEMQIKHTTLPNIAGPPLPPEIDLSCSQHLHGCIKPGTTGACCFHNDQTEQIYIETSVGGQRSFMKVPWPNIELCYKSSWSEEFYFLQLFKLHVAFRWPQAECVESFTESVLQHLGMAVKEDHHHIKTYRLRKGSLMWV